jgi:hypothetical protein
MAIDETALEVILHRVRHWSLGIDEAARQILALAGGGDATTTPAPPET